MNNIYTSDISDDVKSDLFPDLLTGCSVGKGEGRVVGDDHLNGTNSAAWKSLLHQILVGYEIIWLLDLIFTAGFYVLMDLIIWRIFLFV